LPFCPFLEGKGKRKKERGGDPKGGMSNLTFQKEMPIKAIREGYVPVRM